MSNPTTINIKSLPGIKRDGTRFDGGNYVGGTITSAGGYTIHSFTTPNTFTVT